MNKIKFASIVFVLVGWLFLCISFVMAQEPADENAKMAADIYQELQTLLAKGRSMESLRHSNDLAVLEQCGVQMRENQAKAEELRIQAESLPLEYILLQEAANGSRIGICVSCSETALEDCDLTEMALEEYAAGLQADNSMVDELDAGPQENTLDMENIPAQIPASGGTLMVQHELHLFVVSSFVLMTLIGFGVLGVYKRRHLSSISESVTQPALPDSAGAGLVTNQRLARRRRLEMSATLVSRA